MSNPLPPNPAEGGNTVARCADGSVAALTMGDVEIVRLDHNPLIPEMLAARVRTQFFLTAMQLAELRKGKGHHLVISLKCEANPLLREGPGAHLDLFVCFLRGDELLEDLNDVIDEKGEAQ